MFQKNNIFYLFLFLLIFGLPSAQAQNAINSPYSSFGIGLVNNNSNAILDAMGGTSYALQNPYYINFRNPASYAAFDSLSMVVDVAASIYSSTLSTNKESQKSTYARPNYLAIGLPVTKHWATSVGIIPFSTVGYNIETSKTIDKVGDVSYKYLGDGGLMQLYWGNAFKLCKGLSLGLNASYLFGSVVSVENVEFSGDNFYNSYISDSYYLDGIYLSAGLQYFFNIHENHRIGIGAVYSNTAYIWSKENLLINFYQNSYSSVVTYDTVCNDKSHKGSLRIPQSVGGGLSYYYKDKLLVAADVTWQNWKQYQFMGHTDSLKDAITASLGCQYIPNALSKKFFQKMSYRIGAKYSTGNFLIKNKPITEFGVSIGVGIPIVTFNTHSTINLMFEYGKMGTIEKDLLQQNYFKFTFNFTLQEKWYQRIKID